MSTPFQEDAQWVDERGGAEVVHGDRETLHPGDQRAVRSGSSAGRGKQAAAGAEQPYNEEHQCVPGGVHFKYSHSVLLKEEKNAVYWKGLACSR